MQRITIKARTIYRGWSTLSYKFPILSSPTDPLIAALYSNPLQTVVVLVTDWDMDVFLQP